MKITLCGKTANEQLMLTRNPREWSFQNDFAGKFAIVPLAFEGKRAQQFRKFLILFLS